MIGKVTLTSVTYQQFTRKLRKEIPSATKDEIYAEWNRELERYGSIDYPEAARRILDKRLRGK